MHIVSLHLRNFRCYEDAVFPFSPGTNLLLGRNGAGKSNVIEAVYLLATSKSFRKAPDRKLARWGTEEYGVSGTFSSQDGLEDVSLRYCGESKALLLAGCAEKRISSIIGRVFCVLYFFEDVYLVSGPPATRRGYLDLILSTVNPLYLDALQRYLAVLRQKNRYLFETDRPDLTLLAAWNEQLAHYGGTIAAGRSEIIEFINTYLDSVPPLEFPYRVRYRTGFHAQEDSRGATGMEAALRDELERHAVREASLRRSVYGPHRDDFTFTDGRRDVRHFASMGEARLASIVLKLAQAKFYEYRRRVVPILLFDDIFLELDSRNMARVMALIGDESQKIITTTETRKLPEIFRSDRVFHIEGGGRVTWEDRNASSR